VTVHVGVCVRMCGCVCDSVYVYHTQGLLFRGLDMQCARRV